MELEGLVPSENLFGEVARAGQHVAVEWQKLGLGYAVARRDKAMQIAQQETKSIAQLFVKLGAALHQVLAGGHVFAEIDRRDPEANDLAAHAVGDVYGVDAVAERLRHGAALLVERRAGRSDMRGGRVS